MDEPSYALHAKTRNQFKDIINEVKMDKIIILITHDNDIKVMADKFINL